MRNEFADRGRSEAAALARLLTAATARRHSETTFGDHWSISNLYVLSVV